MADSGCLEPHTPLRSWATACALFLALTRLLSSGCRAPSGIGAADSLRTSPGCSPCSPGPSGTCSRASSCRCGEPALGFAEAPRSSTTAWYSKHRMQQKPRYSPISVWVSCHWVRNERGRAESDCFSPSLLSWRLAGSPARRRATGGPIKAVDANASHFGSARPCGQRGPAAHVSVI